MEKNILMELSRIKGLINYNISNGFLIKEDAQGAEIRQRQIDNEILGTTNVKGGGDPDSVRYPTVTLSLTSTEYPIIFPYPNGIPIQADKQTGKPIIWQFKPGDSSKTFISEKQFKVLVGSVEAADKTIKENQEYFEKNGIKYCLPEKAFWDLHTNKKYIYKFQNPGNKKIFNMKLTMLGEDQCTNSGDEIPRSGLDCSKRCMGSNNGWMFSMDGFFETGTGKGYDPRNPDHFDIRSVDDIFWDKYSVWIEIAVGVAVAFAAPYLAAGILGAMATPILAATRIARLITFLGEASVYGGETTWLIISCEILAEAGLLSPLISNYLSRGDTGNAALTMAMCLIPFVTELPSVKLFIAKGFGTPKMGESVVSKINTWGGFTALTKLPKDQMQAVIKTILTRDEQTMFYLGMDVIGKGKKVLASAFSEFIAKNGDTIEAGIARGTGNPPIDTGYKKFVEKMASTGTKALEIVANPIGSAFLQRSFVTSLQRGFIVVGPIVIAFKYTWEKAAEWMTETQKDDVQNKIQDILNEENSYAKALMDLNISCGLGPEIPQEVVDLTIKKLTEDPTFTKFDENTGALIEEKTKEATKEVFEQQIKNIAEQLKKNNTNSTEDLQLADLLSAHSQLSILDKIIMSSGYPTLPDWENDKPTSYDEWKFSVIAGGKEINGVVKFINGNKNYEVYVDTKKIFPTD